MRRSLLTSIVLVALATPGAALAKGPSAARIDGPGLKTPIAFSSKGDPSSETPFGLFVQYAGFFPATYGQSPNPMLSAKPKGQPGPRFTVVYTVPGPNNRLDTIRQDLYPYARPAPLSFMAPGQPFWGTQHTHGGWYVADPALRPTLVAAGLPASPPGHGGSSFAADYPWLLALLGIATIGLLGGLTAAIVRRRRQPVAA